MSLPIEVIRQALNNEALKDIEAQIKQHEYQIRALKAERDKVYSRALGLARVKLLERGIINPEGGK